MKQLKTIPLILACMLFTQCVKEIPVEDNFEAEIVIVGQLLNDTNHCEVRVQESVSLFNTEFNGIESASISVYSENATGENLLITNAFTEQGNGSYSSNLPIDPVSGDYYWIEVLLEDGRVFMSEKTKLKPVVTINSITKRLGFDDSTLYNFIFSDPVDENNFYILRVLFGEDPITIAASDVVFNGNETASIEVENYYYNQIVLVKAKMQNVNYFTYQYYINLLSQSNTNNGDFSPELLFAPPSVNLLGNIVEKHTNRRVLGVFTVAYTSEKIVNL